MPGMHEHHITFYVSIKGSNQQHSHNTVSAGAGLPSSWHKRGPSCIPCGWLFCLTWPRAPWPSNSWVWTWACGKRPCTLWVWLPDVHITPGRPWECPCMWCLGRICQKEHETGSPHLLRLHQCLHPPWSRLRQGFKGPSPPRQGSLGPAPGLVHNLWGAGGVYLRPQTSSFCQQKEDEQTSDNNSNY